MSGRDRVKHAPYKRFIGFPRELTNHSKFRKLTPNGMKLLVAIREQYTGYNNGNLTATWTEAREKWNFRSKETHQNAIHELMHHRFITRTVQGRPIAGKRYPNLYALTWESLDDCGKGYAGTLLPTHEWKEDYGPWKRRPRPKKKLKDDIRT